MRSLTDYKAVIVDLDGTLYYQRPVRAAMAKEMLMHFWRLPDFLIVRKYRRLYENGLNENERLEMLPARARGIIQEWMIERPLRYIWKHRDSELIELLENLRRHNVMVLVCSDYPVRKKLQALCFAPDIAVDAENMGCLKPEAKGLMKVLHEQRIAPGECLVIGDRYEKDGKLAENMGAEYVILLADKIKRRALYKKWSRK